MKHHWGLSRHSVIPRTPKTSFSASSQESQITVSTQCRHLLRRFPKGTREFGSTVRPNERYEGRCACDGCQASYYGKTTYFCFDCALPLHPECFNTFHDSKQFVSCVPQPKIAKIVDMVNRKLLQFG